MKYLILNVIKGSLVLKAIFIFGLWLEIVPLICHQWYIIQLHSLTVWVMNIQDVFYAVLCKSFDYYEIWNFEWMKILNVFHYCFKAFFFVLGQIKIFPFCRFYNCWVFSLFVNITVKLKTFFVNSTWIIGFFFCVKLIFRIVTLNRTIMLMR